MRPLRIYTLDPSVSDRVGGVATVLVPYEKLEPGPIGALFAVNSLGAPEELQAEGGQRRRRLPADALVVVGRTKVGPDLDGALNEEIERREGRYVLGKHALTVGREPEWPTSLWEHDGQVVAWAWAQHPGTLDLRLDPAHPELAEEILRWFDGAVQGLERDVTLLESETDLAEVLRRHGYRIFRGHDHVFL